MHPDLKKAIGMLEQYNANIHPGTLYRVELVFLLFQATLHILREAVPRDKPVRCKDLYSRLLDMSESITSNSDMEAILVQFVFAFPTNESIHEHKDMLNAAWQSEQDHHPAVLLEMVSLLASSKISNATSAPLDACTAILSRLDRFHKRSGDKCNVFFTKTHLNRRERMVQRRILMLNRTWITSFLLINNLKVFL